MRFPKQEPLIAALANDIVNGLETFPEDFPSPPVSPDQLREALVFYLATHKTAVEAAGASEQSTAAKDEALVKQLGWGGRSSGTSLELPGAPRTLEILGTGEGWVLLDWKEPKDGGLVSAYRVQRRPRSEGKWRDIGMAVDSEIILTDQERGTEVDYRVVAVNKAGESTPSPIVTVLL
jgi:hypothetical protein